MKKNILVTGGAGYIGSHVVEQLLEQGSNVYVYDNLSTGQEESVGNATLIIGELSNHTLLESVLIKNKIDSIIHFAGSIVVPESVTDPDSYYSNNTKNSLDLLHLCVRNKIKNFVFSSTAAVYGLPKEVEASEQSELSPINPYGRSKMMTEWMLEDFSKAYDFNYVALRYFNVAGASPSGKIGQSFPKATHLIKVCCEAAVGKRDLVEIFGTDFNTNDGTCVRDYIHVSDLASAHLDALGFLDSSSKSEIFNCGYGRGYSVREVINSVKKVSGVDFKVVESAPRLGDPPSLVSNCEKIKKILNWQPKYEDIDYIVKTALEWEKTLLMNKK